MIRAVTIGGEYGSGRAPISRRLAEKLGWRLIDNALIEEIARAVHCDPELARQYDETTDSFLHRMHKALWIGGFEGVITTSGNDLDAEAIASAARTLIEHAAQEGRCVIVGRGGQCILQRRTDVFHVFIYAPRRERIERVRREQGPQVNAEELMDSWDRRRQQYIRRYFDQDWTNRRLYDLMICSSMGEDAVVETILCAISRAEG